MHIKLDLWTTFTGMFIKQRRIINELYGFIQEVDVWKQEEKLNPKIPTTVEGPKHPPTIELLFFT